jgi:hypothetical protein
MRKEFKDLVMEFAMREYQRKRKLYEKKYMEARQTGVS